MPNANLSVQSDGKVVGCGCIDWLSKNIIGEVKDLSIRNIWLSDKAVAFRNSFENRKSPAICRECGLYSPITVLKDVNLKEYKPKDGLYYYVSQKSGISENSWFCGKMKRI